MSKIDDTIAAIFAEPTRANIRWDDVISVFRHYEADITPSGGSRVRVVLCGVRAVFHRPHPAPQMHRPLTRQVRRLLQEAGVSRGDAE